MAIDVDGLQRIRRDELATGLEAQTINTAIFTKLLDVHTAIPGIIDSFDAKKQTASVRPAIKMLYVPDREAKAGPAQWLERALCVDVPVMFPGAGGYVLTFPVKQGDECLLVFCERTIDTWFTSGGVQEQADLRHHDASDAVAIVGLRSQPNVIEDFNNEAPELRTVDGETVVTLIQADGKVNIKAGTITLQANTIKLDGNVTVTGSLAGDKTADFQQNVTGAGISLQTHIHTGVQTGGGTTGPPQ